MRKPTWSLHKELKVWYAHTFSLYHNHKVQYTYNTEQFMFLLPCFYMAYCPC